MEKLFLFDTSNLVYRSFFGFSGRHLVNSKGEITSGIFGAMRTVIRLYKDFKFENAVFCLDGPRERTKRYSIYANYKINREKAPEDLKLQVKRTVNLLREAGIECVEIPGYESDDIISILVNRYFGKYSIYIVSGDKDLLQLLKFPEVRVISFSPSKSDYEVKDRNSFIVENGFEPEYIVDYLALLGDKVDNIPGAKGIGEKTSALLIQKYKTIENIYSNLDEIEGRVKEKLIQSREDVFLSKQLVTLFNDAQIDIPITRFSLSNFSKPKVVELLKEYEFKSILNEIMSETQLKVSTRSNGELSLFSEPSVSLDNIARHNNYKLITRKSELEELYGEILSKGYVCIDIETDEKHFMECKIVGIAISIEEGIGYYIPILHSVAKDIYGDIMDFIIKVCEDERIKKIGHNIKFEYVILKRYGVTVRNIFFDTMIASYTIRPELTQHNLDRLAEEYLNYKKFKYEEVTRKKESIFNTLLNANIEDVVNYACEDADITLRLYNFFSNKLEENEKLKKLFYEIEMPLVEVLGEMEYNGIKVDVEYLKNLSKELDLEINRVSSKIFDLAGENFNVNSPKQISYILFDKLKLNPVKKTKTGYSTDEEVLEELLGEHEIVEQILKYRTLTKLKTTYVDELPNLLIKSTGRVHTSFNQTITATGRLSSSNPNLQNIPVRDGLGKKIRLAFIANEGNLLGSFDYSQIELRVLAHFSGDPLLIEHFIENRDIHSETAMKVLHIKPEDMNSTYRRIGKIINFGIVYGISPYGLSKQLGVSIQEASDIIQKYFETYKGIKEYIFRVLEFVSKKGYVETMFGRIRRIPELVNKKFDENKLNFGKSERIAINTPIQGTAAEIVKISMNKLYNAIKNTSVKLLLQVHDEIIVELPEKEEENYSTMIKTILEKSVDLKVPLLVEYRFGKSWGELEK
ncbi:MAG: DNA polymerase I [Brevinematales bacterium]|nr:DNA polymerase I [Brevinematales bacterium]